MNNNSIIKGTIWTSFSTIFIAIVQLLRLAILARFLEKKDFGIVAIVTLILGLTHTFCDLGFASAIMHKQKLNSKEFSSLYWIQFIVFTIMFIVIWGLSGPISTIYKMPILRILIPIAMLDLFFKAFGQLYETLLLKNFQFKQIAYRNITSSFFSLLLAIYLAVKGFGVYSLIISTLFNTLLLNIWNLSLGYKIMPLYFTCSVKKVWGLVKIGLFQSGSQILDYICSKLDIIILGKYIDTANLGIYNLAKELILKVIQVINSIVNRVALPYLSKIQNDNNALRRNYCKLLSIISIINIPICSIIGCLSIPIVELLYGHSYSELKPILALFSIWAIIVSLGNPVGNIIIAKGRTDISLKYTIVRISIYLPSIFIFAQYSLKIVVYGQILLAIIILFISWYMALYKIICLKFTHFLKSFYTSAIFFVAIIYPIYYSIKINLLNIPSDLFQLILYSIVIICISIFYLYQTKKKTIISLVESIKNK